MGVIRFIFYGMYAIVHKYTGDILPHLATILLAVFIIIILVVCPYIGLSTQFGSFMSSLMSILYYMVLFVSHLYNVIIENIKNYLENKITDSDISLIELFEDIFLNINEKGTDFYKYIDDNLFSKK